jgi:hypothetical protein
MNNRNLGRPNDKENDSAKRLGLILKDLIDNQIQPNQKIYEFVAQIWEELLPVELVQHCEVSGLSGGQLKILVNSPCYMYELSLCSSKLLAELQRRCPQARLKEIKFAIG